MEKFPFNNNNRQTTDESSSESDEPTFVTAAEMDEKVADWRTNSSTQDAFASQGVGTTAPGPSGPSGLNRASLNQRKTGKTNSTEVISDVTNHFWTRENPMQHLGNPVYCRDSNARMDAPTLGIEVSALPPANVYDHYTGPVSVDYAEVISRTAAKHSKVSSIAQRSLASTISNPHGGVALLRTVARRHVARQVFSMYGVGVKSSQSAIRDAWIYYFKAADRREPAWKRNINRNVLETVCVLWPSNSELEQYQKMLECRITKSWTRTTTFADGRTITTTNRPDRSINISTIRVVGFRDKLWAHDKAKGYKLHQLKTDPTCYILGDVYHYTPATLYDALPTQRKGEAVHWLLRDFRGEADWLDLPSGPQAIWKRSDKNVTFYPAQGQKPYFHPVHSNEFFEKPTGAFFSKVAKCWVFYASHDSFTSNGVTVGTTCFTQCEEYLDLTNEMLGKPYHIYSKVRNITHGDVTVPTFAGLFHLSLAKAKRADPRREYQVRVFASLLDKQVTELDVPDELATHVQEWKDNMLELVGEDLLKSSLPVRVFKEARRRTWDWLPEEVAEFLSDVTDPRQSLPQLMSKLAKALFQLIRAAGMKVSEALSKLGQKVAGKVVPSIFNIMAHLGSITTQDFVRYGLTNPIGEALLRLKNLVKANASKVVSKRVYMLGSALLGMLVFLASTVGEEVLKTFGPIYRVSLIIGLVESLLVSIRAHLQTESLDWDRRLVIAVLPILAHLCMAVLPFPVRVAVHIVANMLGMLWSYNDRAMEWILEFMENEWPSDEYASDAQVSFATELVSNADADLFKEYKASLTTEAGDIIELSKYPLEEAEPVYHAGVLVETPGVDAYGVVDRGLANTLVAVILRDFGDPVYEASPKFWDNVHDVWNLIYPIEHTTVHALTLDEELDYFLSQPYGLMKKQLYVEAHKHLTAGDPGPRKQKVMAKVEKLAKRTIKGHEAAKKTRRIVMVDKGRILTISRFTRQLQYSTAEAIGSLPCYDLYAMNDPVVFHHKVGDFEIAFTITLCRKFTEMEMTIRLEQISHIEGIHLFSKGDDNNVVLVQDGTMRVLAEDISDCDRSTGALAQKAIREFYAQRGAEDDVLKAHLESSTGWHKATIKDSMHGQVELRWYDPKVNTPSGVADTLDRAEYVVSAVFVTAVQKLSKKHDVSDKFIRLYTEAFRDAGYKLKGGRTEWAHFAHGSFLSCFLDPDGFRMVPITPCKLTKLASGFESYEHAAKLLDCKPWELAAYGLAKSATLYRRNPLGEILLARYDRMTKHLSPMAKARAKMLYRDVTDARYKMSADERDDWTMSHEDYLRTVREYAKASGKVLTFTDEEYYQLVTQIDSDSAITSGVWLELAMLHHA